jgi:GT2 family glycosyltransferase
MNGAADLVPSNPDRPLAVGVLVVNYGRWDLALRTANAAIALEAGRIDELILFDDGSPAPPPPEIDSRIRIVRGGVNRGYTRALTAAFSEMRSDLVVLFDADACPLTPFVTEVRERFANDKKLGQLGFLSQDQDGLPTGSFGREPTEWTLLLGQALYARVSQNERASSNLCVFSCCMATRLEAYKQVGGIDETFDFLDADLDYSMRLRRHGWNVAVDPSIKVFHVGGGTPQLQRLRVLRYYKCRWQLLRKYNLITNVRFARAFVLTRLLFERLVLRVFGTFLYPDPEVLADKILGRRELFSYCRRHYR